MEVKDLLQKLEPLLGKAACDEWWYAYLAEDAKNKQQIEQHLQLKALKILGQNYSDDSILLPPPPESVSTQGKYNIGKVLYGNKEFHDFLLKDEDLLSHIIVVGRSGSGKTNAVLQLIKQLLAQNKPFWIFDFKRNYRDLLNDRKDLHVYTVGRDVTNIHDFNALVPLGDAHRHIRQIVALLCKAFFLGEGVASLLIKCFDELYKNFGIYDGNAEKYPTFRNVQQWLESYTPKSGARDGQWLQSTLRAIRVLNFGSMGKAVNSQNAFPIKEYLGKRVIFELDALSKQDKIFFIGLLLQYRHDYKLAYAQREKLQDVLIIEEAHHLLPRKSIGEEESILETLLREERELGTGFIIVDQMASRLSDVAFANTATTIALNQKHKADISTVSNAILLSVDDKDALSKLKIGQAIVRQQERWPKPFLLQIPHVRIAKGSVSDEQVRLHMRQFVEEQKDSNQESDEFLDEVSVKLLQSVHQNTSLSVVQHYQKIGLGPYSGNKTKATLLAQGLLEQKEIRTGQGRTALLDLTQKGAFYLRLQTQNDVKKSVASIEHRYFQSRMAEMLKGRPEKVEVEPVLQNCRPDIWLPEKNIAIEIETGKSKHILSHIRTHLAAGREVIVAVTNPQAEQKIIQKLTSEGLHPHDNIRVLIPKLR